MSKTFNVGPQGDNLRSDARVKYTLSKTPLTIQVHSKVQTLFGASIYKQAEIVGRDLGVKTGKLELEDFGALPFVFSARIEAVLKCAFPEIAKESLPPMKQLCNYTSAPDRFRRSRLYIPGNQPKLMLNAGIHKPDGIILDLEDSVALSEKDSTRFIVRNALRSLDFFGAERMVRVNQGERGSVDLEYIVPHNVHLILLPKVESAQQVQAIDEQIIAIAKNCGRKNPVYLMPIIESARGILKALEIAEASTNIVALAIGLEDYTADIGVQRTDDGHESFFARSMIVNAARAAGIQAIDTVFSDVNNEEALRESVREAKSIGFDGKGCIHPLQICPVNEEFAPSTEEIEKAKQIILAFDEATAKGLGVVSLGSKMIDPPVVKRAQRTIDLAINSQLLSGNWKEIKND